MPPIHVGCPHCQKTLQFTSRQLEQREADVAAREAELRRREEALRLREAEHQHDVRLIRGCLHPDRHPDQTDRYNKALQAFNRLIEPLPAKLLPEPRAAEWPRRRYRPNRRYGTRWRSPA